MVWRTRLRAAKSPLTWVIVTFVRHRTFPPLGRCTATHESAREIVILLAHNFGALRLLILVVLSKSEAIAGRTVDLCTLDSTRSCHPTTKFVWALTTPQVVLRRPAVDTPAVSMS
jgi:hypothetical protein